MTDNLWQVIKNWRNSESICQLTIIERAGLEWVYQKHQLILVQPDHTDISMKDRILFHSKDKLTQ